MHHKDYIFLCLSQHLEASHGNAIYKKLLCTCTLDFPTSIPNHMFC